MTPEPIAYDRGGHRPEKSGGEFSARACRNCNRPVTDEHHKDGKDCNVNHPLELIGVCIRCGSADVIPRTFGDGWIIDQEADDFLDEQRMFECRACDLIASETAEPPIHTTREGA